MGLTVKFTSGIAVAQYHVRPELLSRFPESTLAQYMGMRRHELDNKSAAETADVIMEVPDGEGDRARLFPEVLRYMEDPGGYVPPEKDAKAINSLLAYLGLTDVRSEVKTRRHIETEHEAERTEHEAELKRARRAVARLAVSILYPFVLKYDVVMKPHGVSSQDNARSGMPAWMNDAIRANLSSDQSFTDYLWRLDMDNTRRIGHGSTDYINDDLDAFLRNSDVLHECRLAFVEMLRAE